MPVQFRKTACSNRHKGVGSLSMAAAIVAAALVSSPASAQVARTWGYLTTGNGHGFQVYDVNKNKIVSFLEHPYRYVRQRPNEPKSDGIGRRNLAYDFFFGIKVPGAAGWLNAPTNAGDPEYLDQSNIIHTPLSLAGVNADAYYFSPFGYEGNALVAVLRAKGASDAYAIFNFHMGAGNADTPDANNETLRGLTDPKAVIETGPGGGALVYVALSGVDHIDCVDAFNKGSQGQDLGDNSACAGNDQVPAFQKKLGADGSFAVAVQYVEDPTQADAVARALRDWGSGRAPEKILSDARDDWEKWRKPPSADVALCTDNEKKLWRQSEAILRMGQVREQNTNVRRNNGMVLASLPPGEWHSAWVRDGLYAVVALARMGHFAEAKLALDFFMNAAPVGKFRSYVNNADYKISVVRYFGTGEEEADYSGQPSPNVETDGWGLFLWAVRQYVELSGDTAWLSSQTALGAKVYDVLQNNVAGAMEANVESNGIMRADSSIWEVHDDNKEHFAYTTLTAIRGFCDMGAIAKAVGVSPSKYQAIYSKMKGAFLSGFVDAQGALGGSLEGLGTSTYYDGAVAEAFTWNVLDDPKGATAVATLDLLNKLRVDSGGFKRNNEGKSSYDNNEWILVDLRIANALRRAGRERESDSYVAQIVEKSAANFFLVPELYNAVPQDGQIGKYTGSIPMVGYGAGAYVITMLDRSGIIEPNDCGDGKSATLAKLACGGIDTTPPVGGGGGGGNAGSGASSAGAGSGGGDGGVDTSIPYLPASLCSVRSGPSPGISILAMIFACSPWVVVVRRVLRRRARRDASRERPRACVNESEDP
jgi:GH15 family glucan-1,4-alpha-glucosidase